MWESRSLSRVHCWPTDTNCKMVIKMFVYIYIYVCVSPDCVPMLRLASSSPLFGARLGCVKSNLTLSIVEDIRGLVCWPCCVGGLCGAVTERRSLETVASCWLHATQRRTQVCAECKSSLSFTPVCQCYLTAWRSGSIVRHVNRVTLCWAWWVLGWVTVFGRVLNLGM